MKLSEAKTIEDVASAVEQKLYKDWFYPMTYKLYHHFMIFDVACPTDKFDKMIKKNPKKTVTKKILADKNLFIIDHIKVNLCKHIEPRKSEREVHEWMRQQVMSEITK